MPQTSLSETDNVSAVAGHGVEALPRRIGCVPAVEYEPSTVRGPISDAQLQGWILYLEEPFARSINRHEKWEQTTVRREYWGHQSMTVRG